MFINLNISLDIPCFTRGKDKEREEKESHDGLSLNSASRSSGSFE